MNNIILFENKKDCCGCEACVNICSKQAISMVKDENGFFYPSISIKKCIECGMCKKVCSYQYRDEEETPKTVYVAMTKNKSILRESASGGIFAEIASEIIRKGGIVSGCSMEREGNEFIVKHIIIDNIKDLKKLQGSKYVQSQISDIYIKIKKELLKNKLVLFSGTPCQVAGLKGFLGNKEYENLITIDIICHGVPNNDIFNSYIKELEKKLNGKVIRLAFRDKSLGWGLRSCVEYIDKNNVVHKKLIPVQLSSYYKLFLDSVIYRENCYECKYAGKYRTGDLTIGDYWGIAMEHPDYIKANGGEFDIEKGISCVLINNIKGKNIIDEFGLGLMIKESDFLKVEKHNMQLKQPSSKNVKREVVFKIYRENGYSAVDKWYYRQLGMKKYAYILWNKIPNNIRCIIKKN